MRKIVSILLIVMMLLSIFTFPTSASLYDDIPKSEYKYEDRVKEYIFGDDTSNYREFCYYSNENQEEPDWVLVVCQPMPVPWEQKDGALVGNRFLWTIGGSGISRMLTGIAVYIPKTDTFIDVENYTVDRIIELCPNFVEVLEENNIGQLVGDVNDDSVIDIYDATKIQRYLVEYEYSVYNSVYCRYETKHTYLYISDFDRDGEVTIMDATAIQRHIAGLE